MHEITLRENGYSAPTAIAAGHTTGGNSAKSDEVGAIPLEKGNARRLSGRSSARRQFVRRKQRQHQPEWNWRGQRLPLSLGWGGRRGRRTRSL